MTPDRLAGFWVTGTVRPVITIRTNFLPGSLR